MFLRATFYWERGSARDCGGTELGDGCGFTELAERGGDPFEAAVREILDPAAKDDPAEFERGFLFEIVLASLQIFRVRLRAS